MKLKSLLIAGLALLTFSTFSQKPDSATSNNAAKADVLLQKKVIYNKEEVKNTEPKTQLKQQKHTPKKIKHKRHKWKRNKNIIKK